MLPAREVDSRCIFLDPKGPFGRDAEQLDRFGYVIRGVAVADVAQVGREQREECLDVGVLPMPGCQALDGESVPQVMRS